MSFIDQLASDLTREISAKYCYFSTGAKADIQSLIVEKLRGIVPEPQQSLHFTDADEKANADQCNAIIKLLKARRSDGAVTHELAKLALKYSSRIAELRHQQHYKITAVHESGRTWRYFLSPEDW